MKGNTAYDRCRLFTIDRYGNLFSPLTKAPRCIGSYRRGRPNGQTSGTLFIKTASREYQLTTLPAGEYPTKNNPSALRSSGKGIGCVYADRSAEASKLELKLFASKVRCGGIAMEAPERSYTVFCPGGQENVRVDSASCGTSQLEFRTLSYEVTVREQGEEDVTYFMEQTLSPNDGHRTITIHGIEEYRDLDPVLILVRVITLFGFPSDAAPVQVVKRARGAEPTRSSIGQTKQEVWKYAGQNP